MTPAGPTLTLEQSVALALGRNRDIIAARLEVEGAQVERVAAGIYPNPIFSYSLSNLVMGDANGQNQTPPLAPGVFDQTIHTFGIGEIIDVWLKRGLHKQVADRAIDQSRLLLEDVLREVVYAVRSAFVDVAREQEERELAHETRVRYDETVRISRARFSAGDISQTELKKIELEGLRYQNGEIDAEMQLDVARARLAALLGLDASGALPLVRLSSEGASERPALATEDLAKRALAERPDVRAVQMSWQRAQVSLRAAKREALPDPTLGVAYTHDNFTVSGDNPNTLGLSLQLPLPVFDRNQAGIGRARLEIRRAENDLSRLGLQVRREVAEAVRRAHRSQALVDVFQGGMLERAETALRVAERAYKAGAVSLLELLEAQRTYIETRSEYLRALFDYRQALHDVRHAVGGEIH